MSTAAAALAGAVGRLRAAGVDTPARDARILLAHAMGIDRSRLALVLPEPLSDRARATFERLVAARAARQPVSQLVGHRDFHGHRFRVTPAVLDPRAETEQVVDLALNGQFARVLDLGTGSGAILLSCLAGMPGVTGQGTDTSVAALDVARANAADLGLSDRAEFLCADWFQGVSGRFDLIVSNPPYIADADIAGLAPELLNWEPRGALCPGGDGLSAYSAIAAGTAAHLLPGGRLIVEIGADQGVSVPAILVAAGLQRVTLHHDLDGRPRVVTARSAD